MGTQSLRPVTVRQVLHASQPHSDAPFTFDGAELSQVSIVAWVRSATKNATNVQYTIDDGTGQMDVRKWIDNSMDEGAAVEDIEPNQYVRIMGEIKSFNNKRSITAVSMHMLQDHNEYLFHQLEVIYAHLALTKATGHVRPSCSHRPPHLLTRARPTCRPTTMRLCPRPIAWRRT